MSEQRVTFNYTDARVERLDKVLVSYLPEYSRTRLQSLIKNGAVLIDDQVINKTGYLVEPGTRLYIQLPAASLDEMTPEPIPLDVIFESQEMLIINKPAGMVIHPSPGHTSATLAHAALAHAPELEGVGEIQRPGIVHRLDKETSGLILIAKNVQTHRWLQEQFRQRRVNKVYLALVDGHPPTPEGKIDAPITRDLNQRKKMAVVSAGRGRDAISDYYTLETFAEHTLLEVHPLTGRTHQIRLHLAFLKCPVVGDKIYGRRKPSLTVSRHFLHAAKISLLLPGDTEPSFFEAPLPSDLAGILESLRR